MSFQTHDLESMNQREAITLLGVGSGVAGYAGFIGLTLAGMAAAPLALLAVPAGLVVALTSGDEE